MRAEQVNRASGIALIVLSLVAFLMVLAFGLLQPPQPPPADEGAPARVFQLIVVSLVPLALVFLATADWRRRWRSASPLATSAIATFLAFAALYYFEHLR